MLLRTAQLRNSLCIEERQIKNKNSARQLELVELYSFVICLGLADGASFSEFSTVFFNVNLQSHDFSDCWIL